MGTGAPVVRWCVVVFGVSARPLLANVVLALSWCRTCRAPLAAIWQSSRSVVFVTRGGVLAAIVRGGGGGC